MAYKVIAYFEDLQDNGRPYNVGDVFPADGNIVSAERFAELASTQNRRHIPLIEEIAPKPKRTRKKKTPTEITA